MLALVWLSFRVKTRDKTESPDHFLARSVRLRLIADRDVSRSGSGKPLWGKRVHPRIENRLYSAHHSIILCSRDGKLDSSESVRHGSKIMWLNQRRKVYFCNISV